MRNASPIKKFLLAFVTGLILYLVFDAGFKVALFAYGSVAMNLTLATFAVWLAKLVIDEIIYEARIDAAKTASADAAKLVEHFTDDVLHRLKHLKRHVQNDVEKELDTLLIGLVKEVTGGDRPPTDDEITEIERKFHEKTGSYVKLEVAPGGMNAEISKEPFTTPETTTTTTIDSSTKVTVKTPGVSLDGVKSKSQQRRENAMMESNKNKKNRG